MLRYELANSHRDNRIGFRLQGAIFTSSRAQKCRAALNGKSVMPNHVPVPVSAFLNSALPGLIIHMNEAKTL